MGALLPLVLLMLLVGCSGTPAVPQTSPPESLPLRLADVQDERVAFYQLFCRLNQQIGAELPESRHCDDAVIPPADVGPLNQQAIDRSHRLRNVDIVMVPGLGWDCIAEYVGGPPAAEHLRSLGFDMVVPPIEGLSSSERNAQLIYGYLVNNHLLDNGRPLIFIGYSKGTTDILETLVTFPHVAQQTLAMVSLAGAVWGTPLAVTTSKKTLEAYDWVPGKDCVTVDRMALDSLLPTAREEWFEQHDLPGGIHYYSLATLPTADQISRALRGSYKSLSEIDVRNDSQILTVDQILPEGALLAYLNADHLAIAVPIARDHKFVGKVVLDKNAYPREVLLEAILRYVEADLKAKES